MSCRAAVAGLLALLACALVAARPPRGQSDSVYVLIRGGQGVDGTGAAAHAADVGLHGDSVVFLGDASRAQLRSARTVGAAGLSVAPGFIDAHTHTKGDRSSRVRVRSGVRRQRLGTRA